MVDAMKERIPGRSVDRTKGPYNARQRLEKVIVR